LVAVVKFLQVNPRTSPMKLTRVLEAKWREFDSSNPFTKKDETKDETKSSESSTGMTRCCSGQVSQYLQLRNVDVILRLSYFVLYLVLHVSLLAICCSI